MNIDEIKSKFANIEKDIQCAFCLNPNAKNPVKIEGKKTPDGKQAVAFLCDDHKELEPKFAHQVSDSGRLTTISVEDLTSTETGGTGVQEFNPKSNMTDNYEPFTKMDEKAKSSDSDIQEENAK